MINILRSKLRIIIVGLLIMTMASVLYYYRFEIAQVKRPLSSRSIKQRMPVRSSLDEGNSEIKQIFVSQTPSPIIKFYLQEDGTKLYYNMTYRFRMILPGSWDYSSDIFTNSDRDSYQDIDFYIGPIIPDDPSKSLEESPSRKINSLQRICREPYNCRVWLPTQVIIRSGVEGSRSVQVEEFSEDRGKTFFKRFTMQEFFEYKGRSYSFRTTVLGREVPSSEGIVNGYPIYRSLLPPDYFENIMRTIEFF